MSAENTTTTTETEPTTAELQQQLTQLHEEHEAYRARVRERAIKGYRDEDWTLDALAETLQKLGLEPFAPKRVTRAQLSVEIYLQADTDDAYNGRQAIRQMETPAGRAALHDAIVDAVKAHVADGPAVTAVDRPVSVYIGRADVVEA